MIYRPHVIQKQERAEKFGKRMTEGRLRTIQEGPAPDYPQDINCKDYVDEITITRHSPHGIEIHNITLYMSPKRVDCFLVMQNNLMIMGDNKRPWQMGSYKVGNLIATILGRRGKSN